MTGLIFAAVRIDGDWKVRCAITGLTSSVQPGERRAEALAAMCQVLYYRGAQYPGCLGCGGTGQEDAHDGPAPCRHCDGTGGPE